MAIFDFFRRKRRDAERSQSRKVLAPVDEIAEQGVLVATVAVRLSVKNDIIMNALAKRMDFSEERIRELVHEHTVALADERDDDVQRLELVSKNLGRFGRGGYGADDYSRGDAATIAHRLEVYRVVAQTLRSMSEDDTYLSTTAERARSEAWAEIGDSLAKRAEHPYYSGGKNETYQRERTFRIQQLIEKDLTELARSRQERES